MVRGSTIAGGNQARRPTGAGSVDCQRKLTEGLRKLNITTNFGQSLSLFATQKSSSLYSREPILNSQFNI